MEDAVWKNQMRLGRVIPLVSLQIVDGRRLGKGGGVTKKGGSLIESE